jgi:hypothetical protein
VKIPASDEGRSAAARSNPQTIIATTSVGIFRMNPENRKTTASGENNANEQSPVRQALRSAEKRQA